MVDLLLRHNAHDHESKALTVAINNKDDILIAKLLAIKVGFFLWRLQSRYLF